MNLKTIAIVLCSTVIWAQEIKTKGNRVLIDGKEVAHISDKKRIYTFSDLADVAKFTLQQKNATFIDGSSATWYLITDLSTNKTNEAIDEALALGLSYEKNLVTNFVNGKYKLITLNGIDENALKEFTVGAPTLISEEIANRNAKIESNKKVIDDFFVASNLVIDGAGAIYKNVTIDGKVIKDIVGRITRLNYNDPNFPDVTYTIFDKNNIQLAEWHKSGGVHPKTGYRLSQEMLTNIDKRIFNIKQDGATANNGLDKDVTARQIIATLLFNGYKFGDQMKEAKNSARKELQDEAKAKSNNIYDIDGYLFNEKNEKLIGKITALFQADVTAAPAMGTDLTSYGKTVNITLGNGKIENFKSTKNTRFCVQTPSGEQCYLGLKTIGNSAAIGESLNTLSFDFSQFYKIVFEKNQTILLVDPLNAENFILKIAKQEKGLFVNKSDSKLKKNFTEYVNCAEIVFENLDFKSKEGLIKIVEEYQNKCSK